MIAGKSIDKLKIGDVAEFSKTVTETDIYLYAGITGDFIRRMSTRIRPKALFLRHALRMACLPPDLFPPSSPISCRARHDLFASELSFLAPVRIGDTVTGRVEEVLELNAEKNRVRIKPPAPIKKALSCFRAKDW
jgi:3-hydroxybutyryl-CoA dehydratase